MKTLDSLTSRAAQSQNLSKKQNASQKIGKSQKVLRKSLNVRKKSLVLLSPNKSAGSKPKTAKKRAPKYMNMMIGSRIFKISAKVLQEIKKCQTRIDNLIPRLPFARLIQEIILQYVPEGMRIQREAINALQESAETYLTQYFEDSYACTLHARRSTLIPRDMALVEFLRKTT